MSAAQAKIPTAADVASRMRESLTSGDPTLVGCRPLVATFIPNSTPEGVSELEEYLQEIYMSSIDPADIPQFAGFIAILHQLLPILPSSSIITTWFDIVLRSSFRTPKLPRDSVRRAKELILHGLADPTHPKTLNFRRMIIDLYLLDVLHESSKDDVIEHVSLDSVEQEKQKCWKMNLEETLIADAVQQPKVFFDQINEAFQNPRSRLQLVVLLSQLARVPELSVTDFADSTLLKSLMLSLQVDSSTTVVSVGISVLIMMLPQIAHLAPTTLNSHLPTLLSILCRVICWRDKPSNSALSDPLIPMQQEGTPSHPTVALASDLNWSRLESSFDLAVSPPPDARLFFQFMYGLWPINTLTFLRRPVAYLENAGVKCPFSVGWDEIIDVDEVHSRCKDTASELSDFSRWTGDGVDIAGIVSDCISSDARNAAAALPSSSKSKQTSKSPFPAFSKAPASTAVVNTPKAVMESIERIQVDRKDRDATITAPPMSTPVPKPPYPETMAGTSGNSPPIQELVATHVVLKSSAIGLEMAAETGDSPAESKQHLSHMSKLHRDRIIARSEEAERQVLYNKLKQAKKLLQQTLDELKNVKQEATVSKAKQNEWIQVLQTKLTKAREEKRSWLAEAIELRGALDEAKNMIAKQKARLDDTETERFNLQNQLRDIMPKAARIQEYEKRIEDLVRIQLTWDNSPEMREYRETKAHLDTILSDYAKMEQMVQSLEAANYQLEEIVNEQRRALRSYENRAISPSGSHRSSRAMSTSQSPAVAIAFNNERFHALETELLNTRAEKRILEEKVEELEAMVEYLRMEMHRGGRRGSVHVSRSILPGDLASAPFAQ
ncbi:hypothetical protein FRB99_007182 [Tulasnella sp. 403]|nr:hypothetical protein FRB99_007182 [Tulasnella sp. 403]